MEMIRTQILISVFVLSVIFVCLGCGGDSGGGGGDSDTFHSCTATNTVGNVSCSEMKNLQYVDMGKTTCEARGAVWAAIKCPVENTIGICTATNSDIAYTTRYYVDYAVADAKTSCETEEKGVFVASE